MSEAKFDVDAAEAEYNESREGNESEDLPIADVEELDDDGNPIENEDKAPPGFLSYEDYVAGGGDPDMYRGKKAYEAEHNRIDENKSLKREIKGIRTSIEQTMDAVTDWQSEQRTKIREEVAAELHEARENEDVDGAIAAQKKLDKIDEAPAPAKQPEHPVIQDFRAENPMLDDQSDEYDAEFNADVESFYGTTWNELTQGGRRNLTDGQIKRCLRQAMSKAEDLHDVDGNVAKPLPSESPRNKRGKGNKSSQRRARQTPKTGKAEDYKIKNPRNPRNVNAATEVRDMIKKRYGDDAAKEFEKNLTGEK